MEKSIDGERRCVLRNCPPDKPFKDHIGECVSCDQNDSIWGLSEEECKSCQNRIYTEEGECMTCEGLSWTDYDDGDVSQKDCEQCLPVFYERYGISKEECEKCERKWDGDSCKFVSVYEKGV